MCKTMFPASSRSQQIELLLLAGWALLFPAKQSYLYFFGFSLLLTVFVLRRAIFLKTIVLGRFSLFLAGFNALFILAALFSPHPLKSILLAADILLVSAWFFLFFKESETERFLLPLALLMSLSSLLVVVVFLLPGGDGPPRLFFNNSILQGIVSALAALVFLHSLLQRYCHATAALLALNGAAVVVSASKAAALGLALFAAAMILARRKRWLPYFAALLLLLAAVPNPLQRMVVRSLRHDPYVFDRIQIWGMSGRIFRAHPWVGVGPDLFMDAARRFNFPQEKGLSRYGKLPESPHSDYWKVITETGLPGLALVLLFLFYAVRRLLAPPFFELNKVLLAFLLFQMLLFNILFNYFFLMIFFLLLFDFLPAPRKFAAFPPTAKTFFVSTLALAFLLLFLGPYIADCSLRSADRERDIVLRFRLLNRAELASPLDERIPLAKAALLRQFASGRHSLEAWEDALAHVRRAQQLNRNGIDALRLEAGLFQDALLRGAGYPGLAEEILAPLRRIERLQPFEPFTKLEQAFVLRQFGRGSEAREKARAALALEPDYAAAIVFLHRLDNKPDDDPLLLRQLARIRAKVGRRRLRPGSYLQRLFQIPDASVAVGGGTTG